MKTLKLRIKDKHSKVLTDLATQVNFVWNYVNELSMQPVGNNLRKPGCVGELLTPNQTVEAWVGFHSRKLV